MMSEPLSIVIPTFNRARMVCDAIDAALAFLAAYGDGEIVIVDDASTDGTASFLEARYAADIARGTVSVHVLVQNLGACGAKNAGAALARFGWIIFADSDDQLMRDSAARLGNVFAAAEDVPILFFRCIDAETGVPIGERLESPIMVGPRELLRGWRFGDCLPVVRTVAIRRFPFPTRLRGFEGISYCRITRHFGRIRIVPIPLQRVHRGGGDRISAASRLASGCRRADGYVTMLSEFPLEHGARHGLRKVAAALRAAAECALHRLGFG